MAVASQGARIAIQIVLAIVIVGLAYYLYESITEPWEKVERQEAMTEMTRARMDMIRKVQVEYEKRYDRFTGSLDSLLMFVSDSLDARERDSLFGPELMIDSLPFSPRTGNRFVLAVNDTAAVPTYLLEDPDSDDQIGTLASDPTRVNSASWE